MPTCCVPDCQSPTSSRDRLVNFPEDRSRQQRWRSIIHSGTGGQLLPAGGDLTLCRMHFKNRRVTVNCEPVLFVRDNVLIEIGSCRLCFRFEDIGQMFKGSGCLTSGATLDSLVCKYFDLPSCSDDNFCMECVVQVDMTHAFMERIKIARAKQQTLYRKNSSIGSTTCTSPMVIIKDETFLGEGDAHNTDVANVTTKEIKKEPIENVNSIDEIEISDADTNTPIIAETDAGKQPMIEHTDEMEMLVFKEELWGDDIIINLDISMANKEVIINEENVTPPTPDVVRHKCKKCDKNFRTPAYLKAHMKTHRILDKNAAKLKSNRKSNSPLKDNSNKTHKTPLGRAGRKRTPSLSPPEVPKSSSKTGNTPLAQRIYLGRSNTISKCNLCSATFEQSKQMSGHFAEAHPKESLKTFPCSGCDEVFFKIEPLYKHRMIHTDRFRCKECDKPHLEKNALEEHMVIHHGHPRKAEKFAECPICNKKLQRHGLRRHMRSHLANGAKPPSKKAEPPLSCDLCGKTFWQQKKLDLHQERHTVLPNIHETVERDGRSNKEIKFTDCSICKKPIHRYYLEQHMRTHGQVVKPNLEETKFIDCDICGKKVSRYYLKTHVAYHEKSAAGKPGEARRVIKTRKISLEA